MLIKQTTPPTNEANTYADINDFKAYHNARKSDISHLNDETIEALLIRAMDYLESVYYGNLQGYTQSYLQSTNFPRVINGRDYLPEAVVSAQCILALKASDGALLVDEGRKVIREKLDVLEKTYSEHSSTQTKYTEVEQLLRPYLIDTNNSKKVIRV